MNSIEWPIRGFKTFIKTPSPPVFSTHADDWLSSHTTKIIKREETMCIRKWNGAIRVISPVNHQRERERGREHYYKLSILGEPAQSFVSYFSYLSIFAKRNLSRWQWVRCVTNTCVSYSPYSFHVETAPLKPHIGLIKKWLLCYHLLI